MLKEIRVQATFASAPESWLRVERLLENGLVDLAPLVSEVLPLEDWRRGFDNVEGRVGIKTLLRSPTWRRSRRIVDRRKDVGMCRERIDPGRRSAVHGDRCAGDERGLVRQQERHDRRDLRRPTEPAEDAEPFHLRLLCSGIRRSRDHVLVPGRQDRPRLDGVRPDAGRAVLDGHVAREAVDGGLRRVVRGPAGERGTCLERRDVDDRAARPLSHECRDGLGATPEVALDVHLEQPADEIRVGIMERSLGDDRCVVHPASERGESGCELRAPHEARHGRPRRP